MLLERDPEQAKPCGGGIPSTAFDELEIPLSIPYKSIGTISLVSPSDRRLDIDLKGGSIIIVERKDFDSLLRGLAAEAGTEILKARLDSVKTHGSYVEALVNRDGRLEKILADYLIAADGVNSTVRRALSIAPCESVYTLSCRTERISTQACEFWFRSDHAPGLYSWVFPKLKGVSIGTGSLTPKETRTFLKRFIDRRFNNELSLNEAHSLRGYRIPYWQGNLYVKGRVLFVGDAAGQVMPFTYEGIYYAMKSGEFAARAILEGKPGLYKKLWKRRFHSRFRFMKTIERFFLSDDRRMEQLFDIFRREEVQEASMKLWLVKDSNRGSLIRYINFFRKFLN